MYRKLCQFLAIKLSIDLIKKILYYISMDTFSALADPTRRTILEILATKGLVSASDIYRNFHTTPPAISQHLKVLRNAQLVRVEKHGQKRLYKINSIKMVEIEQWIKYIAKHWEKRFDALDNILANEKKRKEVTYGRSK